MKTLAKRLQHALTTREKSPADLARFTGKSESAVSQWLNGQVKSMRGDSLMMTCEFLRCNAQWLSSGTGASGLDDDLVPGATAAEPGAVTYMPRSSLSATLLRLAEFLVPLDATDRDMAKSILSALAKDPENAVAITAKFERLLGGEADTGPSAYVRQAR